MSDSIIPAHLLRRRVYLLHFVDPQTGTSTGYKHARHYLGSAEDCQQRIANHRRGQGARLTQVVIEAGLSFVVARTWRGGRTLEQKLKSRHNAPRELCPICRGEITLEQVLAEQPPPSPRVLGRRMSMGPDRPVYFRGGGA